MTTTLRNHSIIHTARIYYKLFYIFDSIENAESLPLIRSLLKILIFVYFSPKFSCPIRQGFGSLNGKWRNGFDSRHKEIVQKDKSIFLPSFLLLQFW
jgi:hypothetical protein